MILVTGATGHFGQAAVKFLAGKVPANEIAVLVRDPGKAAALKSLGVELRMGDYNDMDTLKKAFTGISKMLFISSSEVEHRAVQHVNVVNAAYEANIQHIVYTSFQRKEEGEDAPLRQIARDHINTEHALKAAGLNYTFLRNNMYLEGLPMFLGDKMLETGTIYLPADNGRMALASRTDMAEAAMHVLTSAGHENKSYAFSGSKTYTFTDIAAILTNVTGKRITYVSPDDATFRETMSAAGVPPLYVGMFAMFMNATRLGEFDSPSNTIKDFIGHEELAAEDYFKQVYAK